MSNVIKSLRTLVGARKRQGTRLEEALAQQRRQLEQCEQDAATAANHRDDCLQREQQARDDRTQLISQAFTPAALKALEFSIQDLATQSAQSQQAVAQAQAAIVRQQQAVAAVQAEIRRNDQRIESFNERIERLLKERDQAVEEQAEEEAEETAAARFSARQRRAKEPAAYE
jgi:chromosome segregation ATPase